MLPFERAVEQFEMLVGPGECEHAMEGGGAGGVRLRHTARAKFVLDAAHADHGIAGRAFPSRRCRGRADRRAHER